MQDNLLEELKKIELEMFKYYLAICEKHDLKYFLIGGTLLGAVRHKGFIPWDDDIDIGMPRPDYEKFLLVAQKELPEHIFLQTHNTDIEYPNCFAKLRNSDTTFIETSCKNLKINHGIYIDIFPLDGCCISPYWKYRLFSFKQRLYNSKINQLYNLPKYEFTSKILKFKHYISQVVVNLLVQNFNSAIYGRDELYKSYDYYQSKYVSNYGGLCGFREVVLRDLFGEGVRGTFEGLPVNIPTKANDYLTQIYGDYMKFPPIEQQKPHHYCTVIDTKKSFLEYI